MPAAHLRGTCYRYLGVILGLLVLVAAALKAHDLIGNRTIASGVFSSRTVLLIIVEVEFFLGLWLLTGLYPRSSWRVAFACFFGFSLFNLFGGEASCSCFGSLSVTPAIALSIDGTAICALLHCRPLANPSSTLSSNPPRLVLAAILCSLIAIPIALAVGQKDDSRLLVPWSQVYDLGVVSAGGRSSTSL